MRREATRSDERERRTTFVRDIPKLRIDEGLCESLPFLLVTSFFILTVVLTAKVFKRGYPL